MLLLSGWRIFRLHTNNVKPYCELQARWIRGLLKRCPAVSYGETPPRGKPSLQVKLCRTSGGDDRPWPPPRLPGPLQRIGVYWPPLLADSFFRKFSSASGKPRV